VRGLVQRQELGLVGRHVDTDRAVGFAALAGQAEIQRVLDVLVAPAGPPARVRSVAQVTAHHLQQRGDLAGGAVDP
jgi:hypothetical protein